RWWSASRLYCPQYYGLSSLSGRAETIQPSLPTTTPALVPWIHSSSVPFALLDELLHPCIAASQRQKGTIVLQCFRDVWDVKLIADTEAVVRFAKVRPRGHNCFELCHGGLVLLETNVNHPQIIARFCILGLALHDLLKRLHGLREFLLL